VGWQCCLGVVRRSDSFNLMIIIQIKNFGNSVTLANLKSISEDDFCCTMNSLYGR
jgi:hypothetical protein